MKRVLPDGISSYSKSPEFTSDTVPDNLLTHHSLKSGTWGCLNVSAGQVTYFSDVADDPPLIARAGEAIVIYPEERHFVEVSGDAVFFIEFYK